MASKTEVFNTVENEVVALCDTHSVSKKFKEALMVIIAANLAPKTGGASVNLDEVARKDDNGNVVEMMCSVSGVFLPATADFFYEDKAGKGINGLKRLSRQAEGIRKQHIKVLTATERAIMADVLDGVITAEDGKAKVEAARALKPDYSSVSAEVKATEAE